MKGTKPTHEQRKLLSREKLDTYDYLVLKSYSDRYLWLRRSTNEKVVIYISKKGVYAEDGVTVWSEK